MTARDRKAVLYGLIALAAAVLFALATGGFTDPAAPAAPTSTSTT